MCPAKHYETKNFPKDKGYWIHFFCCPPSGHGAQWDSVGEDSSVLCEQFSAAESLGEGWGSSVCFLLSPGLDLCVPCAHGPSLRKVRWVSPAESTNVGFPGVFHPSLTLNNHSTSSSVRFSEPRGKGFDGDIPCRTEYSRVAHSLSSCRRRLLWWWQSKADCHEVAFCAKVLHEISNSRFSPRHLAYRAPGSWLPQQC